MINRKTPQVEVETTDGRNALYFLAKNGAVKAIKQLVYNGADIRKIDHRGESVLFHGLGCGDKYESLLKIFCTHNGDIDAKNWQKVR